VFERVGAARALSNRRSTTPSHSVSLFRAGFVFFPFSSRRTFPSFFILTWSGPWIPAIAAPPPGPAERDFLNPFHELCFPFCVLKVHRRLSSTSAGSGAELPAHRALPSWTLQPVMPPTLDMFNSPFLPCRRSSYLGTSFLGTAPLSLVALPFITFDSFSSPFHHLPISVFLLFPETLLI